ncbi:hypothetical protein NKH89_31325 [Mesorhizobium sp. M0923]|uniref:hypothetical protein n=1 Tax=Mesorhizobium sp. M0923 TaxID=2957028 RepID=UPI00333AAB7D
MHVPIYTARSLVERQLIENSIKVIRTQFYDPDYAIPATLIGGATYRRESFANLKNCPKPAYFRSADRGMPDDTDNDVNGGYWVISESEPSVTMFGAKCDGHTDDTISIQGAVDFVMYGTAGTYNPISSQPAVLRFSGNPVTTDTIHVGYGTTFTSLILQGDMDQSGGYWYADFNDRPAIAVQGGRSVRLRGLSIVGVNHAFLADFNHSFSDRSSVTAWAGPNMGPTSLSRYAPYAGIAIDPYAGPRATAVSIVNISHSGPTVITVSKAHHLVDGEVVLVDEILGLSELNKRYYRLKKLTTNTFELYNWKDNSTVMATDSARYSSGGIVLSPSYPDVNYPPHFGATQYEKNFSSRVHIEDCRIAGFGVGVVVQPCNADGNGDYVTIRDSDLRQNVIAYALGNSQARTSNFTSVIASKCHTVLDGKSFGKQQGQVSGVFSGVEWTQSYQLLNFSTSFAKPMTFQTCYAESVYRIGFVGGAAKIQYPISFVSCHFGLNQQYFSGEYTPQKLLESGDAQLISFDGCSFKSHDASLFVVGSANVAINNCYIDNGSIFDTATTAGKVAKSASLGIWDSATADRSHVKVNRIHCEPTYNFSGTPHSSMDAQSVIDCSCIDVMDFNNSPIPYWAQKVGCGGVGVPVEASYYTNTSGLTSVNRSGREYTVNMTTPFQLDSSYVPIGAIVVSAATLQIYYVKSASFGPSTASLVLVQLTNVRVDNEVWSVKPGSELVTGNLRFWNCARFYPSPIPVYAETTAGSAGLVLRALGANTANATLGALAIGDYFDTGTGTGQGKSCGSLWSTAFPAATVSGLTSPSGIATFSANARFSAKFEYPTFIKASY